MTERNERKVSLVGVNGWFVSARLNERGDLIIDGQDLGGPFSEYEWAWAFSSTTFDLIRARLGADKDADILDVLLNSFASNELRDPGRWLHNEAGIPAEFWSRVEP
ncbi:hypothetical protein [Nocardia yamanashiensis]|uniref:hypothetical protein n=1 Tax=Nocardia yamanashiensis TaxID=209247 RepID=UPI00082F7B5B|nr:hypothetical protein [Nocardia yamanashiensis]